MKLGEATRTSWIFHGFPMRNGGLKEAFMDIYGAFGCIWSDWSFQLIIHHVDLSENTGHTSR